MRQRLNIRGGLPASGAYALCALLGALLYLPSLTTGRLADDFVLERTVRRATSPWWPFVHNDLGQGAGHFYRPVWVLVNAAADEVSHGPALAHSLNLVLFGIVCLEVGLLLRRLLGGRAAVLGALMFACFPSHGESVAWISGNTDLVAVALGLGGLLAAARTPVTGWRTGLATAATGAAVLSKEVAVVMPALAALAIWADRAGGTAAERGPAWRPVWGMLVAVAIALLVRTIELHGIGGYGDSPLTLKRGVGSLASFGVAALSAPQLPVLRHPALLLVPAALAGALALALRRPFREPDMHLRRSAVFGIACFVLPLLPVLNQPLNLNTRNGDRLLLLPSVGIAVLAAVVVRRYPRHGSMAIGALAVVSAVLCISDALNWNQAGGESRRLVAQTVALAPPSGKLVVLAVPTDYRAAHLFPDALQDAVDLSGRADVRMATCASVHALTLRAGQLTFAPHGAGAYAGRTGRDAPFDRSVFGSAPTTAGVGCAVTIAPGSRGWGLGTTDRVLVVPRPEAAAGAVVIAFDGRDMRVVR